MPASGRIYFATLNIAKARDGCKILYSISNVRQIDKNRAARGDASSTDDGRDSLTKSNSTGKSIHDEARKVKERYSYAGERAEAADLEVLAMENGAMPFKTGTREGYPGGDAPSVFSILDRIRDVKNGTGNRERYSVDHAESYLDSTDKEFIEKHGIKLGAAFERTEDALRVLNLAQVWQNCIKKLQHKKWQITTKFGKSRRNPVLSNKTPGF